MANLLTAHDAIVALDYGQFTLCGSWGGEDEDGYMEILQHAIDGDCVAGDGRVVLILSPHQNNFQMPFRWEVWDAQPPDDQAAWEEVFESGLLVDIGRVVYSTPTLQDRTFPVTNGRYDVLICGRGFVNRGWPGSTTPGDSWRVQLWPSTGVRECRRVKQWHPPAQA